MFDPAIVKPAITAAFGKLDPRVQVRNPVMFVVWVVSVLTTVLAIAGYAGHGEDAGRTVVGAYSPTLVLVIALWLWFTVLFANFAEAMAEGRGKAQAASLRRSKRDVQAKKLTGWAPMRGRSGAGSGAGSDRGKRAAGAAHQSTA